MQVSLSFQSRTEMCRSMGRRSMKSRRIFSLVLAALVCLTCSGKESKKAEQVLQGRITISGAWALYPMVVRWSEEFSKLYPEVRIDVSAGGAGKGMADALSGAVDLGMVSRKIYPAEVEKGAWWVAVAKDAVVPVINKANPFVEKIRSKGVTRDLLVGIWIKGTVTTWGQVVGTADDSPIHVYTRSDACGAAETWAQFLGARQEDLLGVGVYGDPGLTEAVRKDALGIGYNNIGYAFDSKTQKPVEGIVILPIDLDSNGMIDEDEDFYQQRNLLVHAIAEGKYPSPPARELYLVCAGEPKSEVVRRFLQWVLIDGQKLTSEVGYIGLSEDEAKVQIQKLGRTK